ncbi:MAG TPA: DUF349 domain-containing protein [Rudaea sp.]
MRELQQQWTALGNGRRGTDQRQWRDFRAACDAAFGKLDEARKERDAMTAAARAQVAEVVEQIEALAASDSAQDVRASLREIDARWQSLQCDDRALEQRYRRARESISAQLKDAARRQRLARYTSALARYAAVRAAENDSGASGDATEALIAPFESAFAARSDASSSDSDGERARDVLVRLEFLAGIESPASERQRRMDFQVKRLSERMRRGEQVDVETELTALMAQWFALLRVPVELDVRFEKAVKVALDSLP